jgi:hypothetical protein
MNPVKSFLTLMLEDAVNHPFGDKLENPIGTCHNFPWPKINGALSAKSSKFMRKAITDNQKWFVSGKIDGCNVSVSSKAVFFNLGSAEPLGSLKIFLGSAKYLKV